MKVKVCVENLFKIEAKLKDLKLTAEKLECEPVSWTVSEKYVEVEPMGELGERFIEYCDVEVFGGSPKLAGWTFVGKIETLESGTPFLKVLQGKTVPHKYHSADLYHCDHCHVNRFRKNAFIVQKNEEFKQVGRSCLKDFIGHGSPESVLLFADQVFSFIKDCDNGTYSTGSKQYVYSVDRMIAQALNSIYTRGFHTSSSDYPTKDDITEYLFDLPRYMKFGLKKLPTKEDFEDALQVIEFIKTEFQRNPQSDYYLNLSKLISEPALNVKYAGYIAAAANSWLKSVEKKAEAKIKDELTNESLGPEGSKVAGQFELINVYEYNVNPTNYYDSGCRWVLTFKTNTGALLKVFTSKYCNYTVGRQYKVTGRVNKSEKETFQKSRFFGYIVTTLAPRARISDI